MSEPAVVAAADAIAAGQGPVEVAGEGALAQALRERLGAGPAAGGTRPAVVVETTGRAEAIAAALERVADLGTVVLAGPVETAPVALDLYADLHVRGLTIVAVPPPDGAGAL